MEMHDEIAELLGAYALDAVDDDERRAVEAHLPECPRCTAEVTDHREVAAMMAFSGAPAPEGVWSKIVDSLEETPPALHLPSQQAATPPEPAAVDDLAARRERKQRRPILLGAAAAALVVGLVAGVLIGGNDEQAPQSGEFAAASIEAVARQVLSDPSATKVVLSSPDDDEITATAAFEPDGSGYLLGTSLPALDARETYQLWGIRDEMVVSLGVLGHSPDVVAFHLDPSTQALAITVETAGGVPVSSNPVSLIGTIA